MRNEEGRLDVATVRIFALSIEDLFVETDVVVVYRVVEGDRDHLGYLLEGQVTGDRGTVFRAETVGEYANGWVAGWRPVRIVVHVYFRRNFQDLFSRCYC